MHFITKLCAAGLAGLLAAGAQAAVITYRYTAIVDRVSERHPEAAEAHAVEESKFAGTAIKLGDVLTGSFRYNTVATPGSYQPDPQPGQTSVLYTSSPEDAMHYRVERTGYSFRSDPALNWLGLSQLQNAEPGGGHADYFSLNLNWMDGSFYSTMGLLLANHEGTAFSDNALPARLDPALFNYMVVDGSFLRLSDSGAMSFSAIITAFEQVEAAVPEPGILFLLGAGVAGLCVTRRRARPASH